MEKAAKRIGDDPVEHKCVLCPYSSKVLSYYKRHLKTHSTEAPKFKCPESGCPYRAKWKANLKKHVQHVHILRSTSGAARPFPCPHFGCSYAAKDKDKLKSHSKIHSDQKSLFCSQLNCNFSTKHKPSLVFHTRGHTGEKPYKCKFESCFYSAASSTQLSVHTRIHTKEKPYKCGFESCSYAAGTAGQVSTHFMTHTKERPFKCHEPNCGHSTTTKSDLRKHEFAHHPKLEEGEECPLFQCPSCDYSGKSKKYLSVHSKNMHTLEKSLKCPLESCEFRCKLKTVLDNHLKTHSEERRYKRELCPFRGKQRSVVLNHITNIHSGPDFRRFKCTEPKCDYASKFKQNLKNHLLIHKGEKNYSCSFPQCDYKAVVQYEVKRHEMRMHEREKRFKCELCSYASSSNGNLISHMRTHTKEEPYFCKAEGWEYRSKNSTNLRIHEKKKHDPMLDEMK